MIYKIIFIDFIVLNDVNELNQNSLIYYCQGIEKVLNVFSIIKIFKRNCESSIDIDDQEIWKKFENFIYETARIDDLKFVKGRLISLKLILKFLKSNKNNQNQAIEILRTVRFILLLCYFVI